MNVASLAFAFLLTLFFTDSGRAESSRCKDAKQVVQRYLTLRDFEKAKSEGLILQKENEALSTESLVSLKPKVTTCIESDKGVFVSVEARAFGITSTNGLSGQYARIEDFFDPPQTDVRRLKMEFQTGKWKIVSTSLFPLHSTVENEITKFESSMKFCEIDIVPDVCQQSIYNDLKRLRSWQNKR